MMSHPRWQLTAVAQRDRLLANSSGRTGSCIFVSLISSPTSF